MKQGLLRLFRLITFFLLTDSLNAYCWRGTGIRVHYPAFFLIIFYSFLSSLPSLPLGCLYKWSNGIIMPFFLKKKKKWNSKIYTTTNHKWYWTIQSQSNFVLLPWALNSSTSCFPGLAKLSWGVTFAQIKQ